MIRDNKLTFNRPEGIVMEDNEYGPTPEQDAARRTPNHDGISDWDPATMVKLAARVIVSRDSSAAYLSVDSTLGSFHASGSSKRNKGEQFDFEVGANLAIARALVNAGREYERRALAKVPKEEPRAEPDPGSYTIYLSPGNYYIPGVPSFRQRYVTSHEAGLDFSHEPDFHERAFARRYGPADPDAPTLSELESEQAEEEFLASVDRDNPDAEGNHPLDDDEKRISLYDRVKARWA